MKKIILVGLGILWIIFGLYLFLPISEIQPLPNALKSNEPGDTVQVPNVSAYYNNYTRQQVMDFYKKQFCCSSFFDIPLPTVTLSHPPEYAKQRIRDEVLSWYFEELVHPFRESLYVSGWTPALAQYSMNIRYDPIEKDGVIYYQKTSVRIMPTPLWKRLVVYAATTGILIGFYVVIQRIRKSSI